jgi:2-hydroxy-3-keto-5-methylthiopentenyl-1-phosphate phosphatase
VHDLTPRLVLDWDGTCTETDALHIVLEHFGDSDVYARVEGQLQRGEISYRDLMEVEFSTVHSPVSEVAAFLAREVRLRPGFHELVHVFDPVILSSGFHELIEPVLAREGLSAEVRANRVVLGANGWLIHWRDERPCPACGDLCKRQSLPSGKVALVGDGYSDRCAALASHRVFARDGLADWLNEQGVAYEAFDDFHDLVRLL